MSPSQSPSPSFTDSSLLCSLPQDILARIFAGLSLREQQTVAAVYPKLRPAIAEASRSPLLTLDHLPSAELHNRAPAYTPTLATSAAHSLRAAAHDLRVLRLHPGIPHTTTRDLLSAATRACPCLVRLAFRDSGALFPALVESLYTNLRMLGVLEVADCGTVLLPHLAQLPPSCTQVRLVDTVPKLLAQLLQRADEGGHAPGQRRGHQRVKISFREGDSKHRTRMDTCMFMTRLENKDSFLLGSIAETTLLVTDGFVQQTIFRYARDIIPQCVQGLAFSSPLTELDELIVSVTITPGRPIGSSGSPIMFQTHVVLTDLFCVGAVAVSDEKLRSLRHVSVGWNGSLGKELDTVSTTNMEQVFARLRAEASTIREVSVRCCLDLLKMGALEASCLQIARRLVLQHVSIQEVNVSCEILGSAHHPGVKALVGACNVVSVLRLCDPRSGRMLKRGQVMSIRRQVVGIAAFLNLLRDHCPRLRVLYVQRVEWDAWHAAPVARCMFTKAERAMEQFEKCRPEVDVKTLRVQVEDWINTRGLVIE